jgi:hypothetical protein
MRFDRVSRAFGARILHTMLLAAILAAVPTGPAAAWVLRYTTGYGLAPNPPLTSQPTTFLLYGVYPTRCGSIVSSTVVDPAHIAIHVRSDASCPDSSVSTWAESFPLGMLSAGNHDLTITLTMERADSGTTVQTATFTFGVEDSSVSPPPPPPPPVAPLVSGWSTDPSPATPTVPVRLNVAGYMPFPCAGLTDARVIDPNHVTVTMSWTGACSDTSQGWAHSFELGVLAAGSHVVDLAVVVVRDSVPATTHIPLGFAVVDTGSAPPPPPSGDSLAMVLSPARPNPFDAESRFSVSLENGTHASVAVFDVNGRRVRTVFEGRFERGTTQLSWDGHRQDGSRAPAGLYFYRLVLPGRVIARRVVLLPQP